MKRIILIAVFLMVAMSIRAEKETLKLWTNTNILPSHELVICDKHLGSEWIKFYIGSETKVLEVSNEFMKIPEVKKKICEVYGHRWEPVVQNWQYVTSDLVYRENDLGIWCVGGESPERRRCSICGRIEELRKTEKWVEVKK